MTRRPRVAPVAMAFILVASACGPTIDPQPSVPSFTLPSIDMPTPSGGGPGEQPSGSAPPQPVAMAPMPADIVAAVDSVFDANSHADRVSATTAVLAMVGVSVSGDETASALDAAGIVLAPEEVEIMAAETGHRQYRATLAEFAEAFGGMALLPPNDALAADLPEGWSEGEEDFDSGLPQSALLDLAPLAERMASVVSRWVASAIEQHGGSDPVLIGLTNAPLLLAELARRAPDPIDLAQPFSARDHQLGWLEVTVLVAGMRAMLAGAEAAGIAADQEPRVRMVLAGHVEPPTGPGPHAQSNPCSNLKQMIDSRVPLVSTHIGRYVGDQIKGFIQNFVNALFGEASSFAKAVGQAFKVLGLIAKVQALIMIYSESKATVTLDPSIYHKPDGSRREAGAVVEVGIPDAAWEAAKAARELSPFATALRVCARHLGLPVWQDLVDVGEAMSGWSVQWELSKGGSIHAEIPTRDQFQLGRLERRLTPSSDHTATDAIIYNVLPERREDHPGQEKTDVVELCAHVFPKEPPNGLKEVVSGAGVIAGLATGGYSALVGVIASLLTGWIKTVVSIDDCGQATVSFHVPQAATWHGTITATTTVYESAAGVERVEPGGVVTSSSRTLITATDRFSVSGNEDFPGSPFLLLQARQYTNGTGSDESTAVGTNIPRGCLHDFTNVQSSSGSWGFDADSTVTVMLDPDGSYLLSWSVAQPPEEVVLHGEEDNQVRIHHPSPHCIDVGTGTSDRDFYPGPTTGSGISQVEGRLDPANPGSVLSGSTTFRDDRSETTILWELVRDGPIQLP